MRRVAARFAKYAVWVIGAGVSLSFLGAEVQPLLSAVLIIGIIAVLALRGIAENFGAGLVIQTRRTIEIGDTIETMGYIGTVSAVDGQAVVIDTVDGQIIHLPNAEVLRNPIVNDSAHGRRRSAIEVRVATGIDAIDRVRDLVATAVTATASVDPDIAPVIATTAIEPARLTLQVKVWHDPVADIGARSDVMHAIAAALANEHYDATVQAPPPAPASTPPPKL
jgi:small-conductance mechanosensitive channel